MGSGRWDPSDWAGYSSSRAYDKPTTKTADIFASAHMDPSLDPKGVEYRESCDSEDNPLSTAVIVGLDETGSMGRISDVMARTGLNTLATEMYSRRPISDPHLCFMGIGDAEMGDLAPLQVTQFEADIRIADQLAKIWLEGKGGGNYHESYLLPWYFAAFHTKIDCFLKRGKKGYLFTIGDEQPQMVLHAEDVERVLGYRPQADLSAQDLLVKVSQMYHVYHIMVAEGSHFSYGNGAKVQKEWSDLLGQRALLLEDHTKLAEVIVSTIQINEGEEADKVLASWDGTTGLVVRKATEGLVTSKNGDGAVIRL